MAAETNVTAPAGGAQRLAVGRNTLILLVSNLSSAAFGLVISIVIARGAGDVVLGTYSLALAWALTLAQFADLGMSTLLTRDLARAPRNTASYLRASLLSKTVLGILLSLALVLAAPALASDGTSARSLQLGAAMILLSAWYASFTAVFRAFGRMLPILILNVGGLALQAIVTFVLVLRGAQVETLVLLASVIQALELAGAILIYRRQIPQVRDQTGTGFRYMRQLLALSLPFAIAGILASLELRANIFLLGALDGAQAVGWYSAASRLNEGIRLAPNAFFGAILPALAALSSSHGTTRLQDFFRRREIALLAFGGAAALGLTATAHLLIPVLYGDAFKPAVPVLIVLGWGLIPALISGLLILYLYAHGDERYVNWLIGAGLVIQVTAALVLMRLYGAVGAAAATLLSDCVLWFLLRRRITQLERGTGFARGSAARALVPPGAVFALALALRLIPLAQHSFDGLYGQDAYAYYGYARELFRSLSQLQLPPPFWWPLGYPALLNLGFLFGGVTIGSAQGITVLSGALIAPFAYLLAHEAAPEGHKTFAAWTAGLICAAGGQLAQSSVVIMADAPALLFATLGAWLLLRYARTGKLATYSLASFAVGMAVWTRWQNLIVLGAWALALIAIEGSRAAAPEAESRTGRRTVWRVALAFAIVGLVLAPRIFPGSSGNAPLAGQSWLEGWSPANFFARTFDNVDGHFEYALPVAIFYGQVFLHPAYLFAALTPLFLIGTGAMARRLISGRKSFGLVRIWGDPQNTGALLLLSWIGGMFLFLAGIPYENFRFSLGLFVPLAVVTGVGGALLWTRLSASRVRFLLAGWIAVALLVMVLWQPRVLAPILEIKTRELDQARWLEQQIPPTAVIWTLGQNGALDTYTHLRTASVWNATANELQASAPAYLFLDTENLKTQWRGTPVQDVFETLRAGGHLYPVGARGEFELFRIE